MAEFKAKSAAVTTLEEMWAIEDYLRCQDRDLGDFFRYRYSHLLWIFVRLVREGHLDMARLNGLSEEKLNIVRELLRPR